MVSLPEHPHDFEEESCTIWVALWAVFCRAQCILQSRERKENKARILGSLLPCKHRKVLKSTSEPSYLGKKVKVYWYHGLIYFLTHPISSIPTWVGIPSPISLICSPNVDNIWTAYKLFWYLFSHFLSPFFLSLSLLEPTQHTFFKMLLPISQD